MKKEVKDGCQPSKVEKVLNNKMVGTIDKPFESATDSHERVDQEFEFVQAANRIKRRGYIVCLDDDGHEIVRYRARRW